MSKSQRVVLTIDLGTSGPKVALITTRGEVLAHAFEPVELILPPGGGAEQDPIGWWTAIVTACRRMLAQEPALRDRVEAVGCTAHWSGTVPLDAAGQPLTNGLIWMDARGAPHVKEVVSGWPKFEGYGVWRVLYWLQRTGGAPTHSGKDSLSHILYLKHNQPEIYARTHTFLEPKDYLNYLLTGRMVATYDSIILHWVTDNRHPERITYDARLLAYTGIDRQKLPELIGATEIVGTLRKEAADALGLPEHIKVIGGTPDVQSATIGSGAVRDFEGHVYIGTSSWLSCHLPFKKTDILRNIASLPAPIPGRYFVATDQETAGECLDFLKDKVFFPEDELELSAPSDFYERLFLMAERIPPGSERLIFLPWLYGERTPIEDPHVRGGFFNLSLEHTRAHLVRAVLEGVAFNSRWLLEAVEHLAGRRLDPLHMIGGGARSELWCQIYADVLGRTIEQVDDPIHANLRGVAFLAGLGLGDVTIDELPDCVKIRKVFQPDARNHALYSQMFAEFVSYYRANKAAWKRLNARAAGSHGP